ncbi:MAG: Uma2 family endonuclease [Leptolyngbyaceae bacterium]|nr:Uma2 family endonuclease [Leptolyngbyaceae bacterium]
MVTSFKRAAQPPILENGDRLTRSEFERRYANMPQVKKAELIEGVVYVAAALRYRRHGNPHSYIMGWLNVYAAYTPGVETADNTTVRLDLENEPQPDALLRIEEAYGGQSLISEDDYIEGAPELIVEIASSSASYDLHDKLRAYKRNGVQEYLVWLTEDHEFRWYRLQDDDYVLQNPDASGLLKSFSFPGLWLNVTALLSGQMAEVLTTQQRALDSEDHRHFVARLQSER